MVLYSFCYPQMHYWPFVGPVNKGRLRRLMGYERWFTLIWAICATRGALIITQFFIPYTILGIVFFILMAEDFFANLPRPKRRKRRFRKLAPSPT